MRELALRTKPYRHWIMLIPLSAGGLWFCLLERVITTPTYLMYAPLDDSIPFVPAFVIPYALWYGYVALPAAYFFFRSPEEFTRMALFLSTGTMIACLAYTLFPNGQALRPQLQDAQGPLNHLIQGLYRIDTPVNSAPSLHVIDSVAAHAAVAHYNRSHRNLRWVSAVSLTLAVLCILSTVFIKQHSVIDLFLGLIVAAVLYIAIYHGKLSRSW